MQENSDEKRDELIFALIQRRLDGEWQRLRDLDSKANNMIGFVSIAVGVLLGTGTIGFVGFEEMRQWWAMFFFLGTGLLILSIILSMAGFKIRKWSDVPDVKHLIEQYTDKPYLTVLKRNAGEMKNVVLELEEKLNTKARWLEIAWYPIVIGMSFVFIFVIAVALTRISQVQS